MSLFRGPAVPAGLLLSLSFLASLSAETYPSPEAVLDALRQMESASEGIVVLETIGETREKRPILSVMVALPGERSPGERQAIIAVANLEGNLPHTTAAAMEMIRELVRRREEPAIGEALRRHTFYFIPLASPDAAARLVARPLWQTSRNSRPVDEDRDFRMDEDGPDDLDGDGEILWMRVPDPDGPLVIDGEDPRILRPLRPEEMGSARFRLEPEGTDGDGDGLINEDPPGGVDVASNFPHDPSGREPGAGPHAASEPEARSLLDFVLARPSIDAGVVYGAADNLIRVPEGRDGPPEKRGEHRLWKKDAEVHGAIGKVYEDIAARREGDTAPGKVPRKALEERPRGSWHETLYFELGIFSVAASLFGGEPPASASGAGKAGAPKDGAAKETGAKPPDAALAAEKGWLAWNDAVRQGEAFEPWKPHVHPTLGRIDIGGWRPNARTNPPPVEAAALAGPQVAFLIELASRLPRVEVDELQVKQLGDGLFEVRARIVNRGALPTSLVQGVFTRRRSPLSVELSGDGLKLLGDEARRTVDSIQERGAREFRWLVLGPRGGKASVVVRRRSLPLLSEAFELIPGGSL